jgi:hypothetical protein
MGGVGVGLGVDDGDGVEVVASAGLDSGVGDGEVAVGAQDMTKAASAAAPIHRRAIRDRNTGLSVDLDLVAAQSHPKLNGSSDRYIAQVLRYQPCVDSGSRVVSNHFVTAPAPEKR